MDILVGSASGGPPTSPRTAPVAEALHRIDAETEAFAAATGIRCPDGCGACCHSPHVEATAAELAPLAEDLAARADATVMLERLEAAAAAGDRRCVLFAPDPGGDPRRGRCTEYALRPSICRGFGFAGRRGPDGEARFSPCPRHVEAAPDVVAAAVEAVHAGRIPLPVLPELAARVRAAADDGAAPGPPRPINEALGEALRRAALRARLAAAAGEDGDAVVDGGIDGGIDGAVGGDDRDDRPPARPPRRPMRPAA